MKVLTDPTIESHLHGHTSRVTSLCFDPQSNQFVSSSDDHSLMVWNMKGKMRAFKFIGHTDIVSDVSVSPVGQLVASSSFDQTVRLWVPTLGGSSGKFRAHTKPVQSVHFSYDGLTLLTASNDKSIKKWLVERGAFLSSFTGHTNWVRSARFSHDAKSIVTASDDKSVKIFDHRSNKCIHTFTENTVPNKAVFHPDDIYVAAAMSNRRVKLYDLRSLRQLQLYECHEGDVKCVEFHPNGNYLFSVSKDGTTKIIDLLEGRTLYTLDEKRGPLSAVAASPSGSYFAVGGEDGQILLWKATFQEIESEEEKVESNVLMEKSVYSSHSNRTEMLQYDEDPRTVDKENIQFNANMSSIVVGNTEEDTHVKLDRLCEDFKSLSWKVDSIVEASNKMKERLADLDERCRRLENLSLDSS